MLTIVGAIASVSNGCSRAAWAFLMDKFGFKCVFLIISVINLITSGLLGYTNGNAAAYLILLAVTMGCEGGLFATFPAVSGKIFGHKVIIFF
jgi:nitrate/nitrite transporter NarK